MDDLREKVARAIWMKDDPLEPWDTLIPGARDLYFRLADAALAATDTAQIRNTALREAHDRLKSLRPDYREVHAHSNTGYVNGYARAMIDLVAMIDQPAPAPDPMVPCPAKGCGTGICGLCGTEGEVSLSTAEAYEAARSRNR